MKKLILVAAILLTSFSVFAADCETPQIPERLKDISQIQFTTADLSGVYEVKIQLNLENYFRKICRTEYTSVFNYKRSALAVTARNIHLKKLTVNSAKDSSAETQTITVFSNKHQDVLTLSLSNRFKSAVEISLKKYEDKITVEYGNKKISDLKITKK